MDVKSLQTQLQSLGYDIGSTGVDGIWGKKFHAALTKALAEGYVYQDGKLVSSFQPSPTSQNAASSRVNIKALQTQLSNLGYSVGSAGVDGIWGISSQRALNRALADGYTLKGGQLTKSNTFTTPIKRSTQNTKSDPSVKSLQTQLMKLGYDVGTFGADGIFGKYTQRALAQAKADGYTLQNGSLVVSTSQRPKPAEKPETPKLVPKAQPVKVNPDVTKNTTPVQPPKYNGSSNPGSYVAWTPTRKQGQRAGTSACAQYANDALRNYVDINGNRWYNYSTLQGDAWTRFAAPSARMVFSGYDSEIYDRNAYSRALSEERNRNAADRVARGFSTSMLNPNRTYMVNMYYIGSHYTQQAWERGKNGLTGTHTGNLYFDKNTQRWRVSHNLGGTVHDQDLSAVLGSKGKWGITAIAEAVPSSNPLLGKLGGILMPRYIL